MTCPRVDRPQPTVSSRFSATYNGDGLRASKTDLFSATYNYTWGPGGVLYDGATTYTPGLAQRYGTSASRFYHSDWVGSTRYLSENTGLVMPLALRYDAYGQRTALAGPNYPTTCHRAGRWGTGRSMRAPPCSEMGGRSVSIRGMPSRPVEAVSPRPPPARTAPRSARCS